MVADEYDTTTTFEEIFEGRKTLQPRQKRKQPGEPTLVLETIEQYINQYLKLAGFEMTSREFYEWKNSINSQPMEEEKERKKARYQTS